MSACGEHYALYCDVCQTFWPEHRETAVSPITTAADREELELPSRQAPSQVNSAGLRRVCIKKDGSVVE